MRCSNQSGLYKTSSNLKHFQVRNPCKEKVTEKTYWSISWFTINYLWLKNWLKFNCQPINYLSQIIIVCLFNYKNWPIFWNLVKIKVVNCCLIIANFTKQITVSQSFSQSVTFFPQRKRKRVFFSWIKLSLSLWCKK